MNLFLLLKAFVVGGLICAAGQALDRKSVV